MLLQSAVIALCLLTSTVHLFPQGGISSSREDLWDYQKVNKVSDKTQKAKPETGSRVTYLKSHLDNKDLFSHDALQGRNPLVEEVRRKLGSEPVKLYTHLMQELSRLQEKLSLYTEPSGYSPASYPSDLDRSEQGTASYQSHLTPLAHLLGTLLSGSLQDLCHLLQQYAHSPEAPAFPGEHQDARLWFGQTVERGLQDMRQHLQEFDTQASRVAGYVGGDSEGEQWREAVARLGRELESAMRLLQKTPTDLLTSPEGPGGQLSQTVDRFCGSSSHQIESFRAWVEQQAGRPESSQMQGTHKQGSTALLDGDFSTKLSTLLKDIRQTLS